jgi:hypothetical protein
MKQSKEEKSTPPNNPTQTNSIPKRNDQQKYDRREQMSIGLRKTALQMEKSMALEGIRRIEGTEEYDEERNYTALLYQRIKRNPKPTLLRP